MTLVLGFLKRACVLDPFGMYPGLHNGVKNESATSEGSSVCPLFTGLLEDTISVCPDFSWTGGGGGYSALAKRVSFLLWSCSAGMWIYSSATLLREGCPTSDGQGRSRRRADVGQPSRSSIYRSSIQPASAQHRSKSPSQPALGLPHHSSDSPQKGSGSIVNDASRRGTDGCLVACGRGGCLGLGRTHGLTHRGRR